MPPPSVVRSRAATKVLTERSCFNTIYNYLLVYPLLLASIKALPWLAVADDVDGDGCGGGGVPFLLHPTRAFFLFGSCFRGSNSALLKGLRVFSFGNRCRKGVTLL